MTSKSRYTTLVVLGLLTLSGCGRKEPVEEQHTVSWYVEHTPERTETVKWCSDDAGRAATPICVNAEQAVEQIATRPNAPNTSSGVQIP